MAVSITISGLGGQINLDDLPDNASVADVRQAAAEIGHVLDGLALRADGQTVSDEASTPVRDGQTLVSTAPSPKHGA